MTLTLQTRGRNRGNVYGHTISPLIFFRPGAVTNESERFLILCLQKAIDCNKADWCPSNAAKKRFLNLIHWWTTRRSMFTLCLFDSYTDEAFSSTLWLPIPADILSFDSHGKINTEIETFRQRHGICQGLSAKRQLTQTKTKQRRFHCSGSRSEEPKSRRRICIHTHRLHSTPNPNPLRTGRPDSPSECITSRSSTAALFCSNPLLLPFKAGHGHTTKTEGQKVHPTLPKLEPGDAEWKMVSGPTRRHHRRRRDGDRGRLWGFLCFSLSLVLSSSFPPTSSSIQSLFIHSFICSFVHLFF